MPELTIFYDGGCPLCVSEMRHLCRLDREQKIVLEDIHAEGFSQRFPHIDPRQADQMLHGQLANGEMIYALDVTYTAWALVGKRHWVSVLRWPLVKQVSHWVYLFFARHRSRISKLLTGSARCKVCDIKREKL
ncbi:MAG: putative DCC family thiol-disulfide oxidoreductase YuxK [Motiliproteus sp.]|jgi:predicted DCC family thiol-disulfide oxidoreductase YuxK